MFYKDTLTQKYIANKFGESDGGADLRQPWQNQHSGFGHQRSWAPPGRRWPWDPWAGSCPSHVEGPVATSLLLAGVCALLCPGHCGLSPGDFRWLRGCRPRVAEPYTGGLNQLSRHGDMLLIPWPRSHQGDSPPFHRPLKSKFTFFKNE